MVFQAPENIILGGILSDLGDVGFIWTNLLAWIARDPRFVSKKCMSKLNLLETNLSLLFVLSSLFTGMVFALQTYSRRFTWLIQTP